MSEPPIAAAGGAPHAVDAEDAARAGFYALLSRLYAGPPDAALLAAIAGAAPLAPDASAGLAGAEGDPQDLASAWAALRAASATAVPDALAQEYDDVFVGVGRSEVNLHASHWLTGFMMERPLAELRGTLARLGLARRPEVPLVEDHLSALCETMRILICGHGSARPASLAEQKSFFERHLEPWAPACCAAIGNCSLADYYKRVAQFTACFLALERDSFAME
jgi:TorA maturation chaperone TorD